MMGLGGGVGGGFFEECMLRMGRAWAFLLSDEHGWRFGGWGVYLLGLGL